VIKAECPATSVFSVT